jgi:hypothetical protein
MTKFNSQEVLGFEINRETVPGLFNRLGLRWNAAKICREQNKEAVNDYYALADRFHITNEDRIKHSEAWQKWENEKSLYRDRIEMRKQLAGLEIAQFLLDRPKMGSTEIRNLIINERDRDFAQVVIN